MLVIMQTERTKLLGRIAEIKPLLMERFPIRSIGLFGSYARGDQQPHSDVDILVDVDPAIGLEFVSLAEMLENHLGRRVDRHRSRRMMPLPFRSRRCNSAGTARG